MMRPSDGRGRRSRVRATRPGSPVLLIEAPSVSDARQRLAKLLGVDESSVEIVIEQEAGGSGYVTQGAAT